MYRSSQQIAADRRNASRFYDLSPEIDGRTWRFHSMAPRSCVRRGEEAVWLTDGREFLIVAVDPQRLDIYPALNPGMSALDWRRAHQFGNLILLPSEVGEYTRNLVGEYTRNLRSADDELPAVTLRPHPELSPWRP